MPKSLALLLVMTACSAPAARPARTALAAREAPELARQRDRIRELEAMVGVAQGEASALREHVRSLETALRSQTTRIEPARQCEEPMIVEEAPEEPQRSRPVLRLYGPPPIPEVPIPPILAAPPPASLRLPVAIAPGMDPELGVPPIPEVPVPVMRPPEPPPPPRDDGAVTAYRAALTHLSAQRFEQALAGLDAFLRDYPRHSYADNALYWRGEIHYARRDYRRAIAELSALVERYPNGNKVPEALLRIGLCYEHMGDRVRARQVLERLRRQYPDSVAARMAAREDV